MMIQIVLIGLSIEFSMAFRGPHHPRSSVSHHHYVPQGNIKLTQDSQLLHDTAHLVEDMGHYGETMDISKMNDEELSFYYFKAHDIDNNTKLDGLEMLHAIQHTFHEHDDKLGDYDSEKQIRLIIELIDRVLEEDDMDNDGYLGYIEYVLARQRSQNDVQMTRNNIKL